MADSETLHQTKIEVKLETDQDGQVILHCHYQTAGEESPIRIWESTYLIDASIGHKSTLVYFEGITMYPEWLILPPHIIHVFTLVFTPLPKSTTVFDLFEDIPQLGGFVVKGIRRNKTDVYRVRIN